jgi:peptidoglycan/LPS O-acetylase OafA/YrhL
MAGLFEWQNNVGFVIAFLATVIVSLLSYNLFEKPFLRLKGNSQSFLQEISETTNVITAHPIHLYPNKLKIHLFPR